MSKQVPWNNIILEEFTRLAGLNELEQNIMRDRMLDMPRTQMCIKYDISMATLDRMIKRLKVKYDNVQPYSDKLPPRKYSVKETYMDSH